MKKKIKKVSFLGVISFGLVVLIVASEMRSWYLSGLSGTILGLVGPCFIHAVQDFTG